jgi:hypothetical protein
VDQYSGRPGAVGSEYGYQIAGRRERPTARQAGGAGKKNFKRREMGEKQEEEN